MSSTCVNVDPSKRRGSNLNLTKFYDDVNVNDHLPNFVRRSKNVELRGMGFNCGAEKGKQLFTFNIRWTDSSSDAKRKWEAITESIKNRTVASASLTDLHQCDGPCKGFHHYQKMMLYPDCSHVICTQCCNQEESAPNPDGTPGCCVDTCYRESLINRVPNAEYRREALQKCDPFTAIPHSPGIVQRQKASSDSGINSETKHQSSTNLVPTELLQIRVVILEKPGHTIVRSKLEFELPSDFSVSYILDVVEEKIKYTDGIEIYYTTEPIRSKKHLIPITIVPDDKRTLGSVAKGRNMMNFVVSTPGIRMFEEKTTKNDIEQSMAKQTHCVRT
ncbi:hypothetical protein RB195_015925 [Necator americanus]|uniref:Uncharacterized protein n=1 Tax=Necator americanus TaxID=51031 RepID=A0ABR1E7E9_NECAM